MNDERIEDVSCDGVGIRCSSSTTSSSPSRRTSRRGRERPQLVRQSALARDAGSSSQFSNPILDGTTPEGHRVQATYAREVTTRGHRSRSGVSRRSHSRRSSSSSTGPLRLTSSRTCGSASSMASPPSYAVEPLAQDGHIECDGPVHPARREGRPRWKTPGDQPPHENWIPGAQSGVGERGPDARPQRDRHVRPREGGVEQRPHYIIVGESEQGNIHDVSSDGHWPHHLLDMHVDP